MSGGAPNDISALCIPFILERLAAHRKHSPSPLFVGLNGIQGSGKTTLVKRLRAALSSPPHFYPTISLSIDDLYLPHSQLLDLRKMHAGNPLLQVRGQPGTHDLDLGVQTFSVLRERNHNVRVPSYDKSAYDGQGERRPEAEWDVVNLEGDRTADVVLFEGWCVGFQALENEEIKRIWQDAIHKRTMNDNAKPAQDISDMGREQKERPAGRLCKQRLEHLDSINDMLKGYDILTDQLDAFIYLDAEQTEWVYDWRLEQEQALRATTGKGMTDEAVVRFVNSYYPAYELYSDRLRSGIFSEQPGTQMNITIDKERKVVRSKVITSIADSVEQHDTAS